MLELLADQRCALTATEIETRLRQAHTRPVSRASVYRILDELEQLHLVVRVGVGQPWSAMSAPPTRRATTTISCATSAAS